MNAIVNALRRPGSCQRRLAYALPLDGERSDSPNPEYRHNQSQHLHASLRRAPMAFRHSRVALGRLPLLILRIHWLAASSLLGRCVARMPPVLAVQDHYKSDAEGNSVGVIVPITLWREIESERETAYLL